MKYKEHRICSDKNPNGYTDNAVFATSPQFNFTFCSTEARTFSQNNAFFAIFFGTLLIAITPLRIGTYGEMS